MATDAPRRLRSEQRREQLEEAALASVAARGSTGFSIEDVAERAGVTRNLIYHYFPRGRQDLLLAAVDRSGHELTNHLVTEPEVPLAERQRANFAGFIRHAAEPTDAWRVSIDAGLAVDPELRAAGTRYRDRVVRAVALNNLGTTEPGPLAKVALRSYLAFAETVLEEGREAGLDQAQMLKLAERVLAAAVDAVQSADAG
jgi:AcrR family transcriptional regulator